MEIAVMEIPNKSFYTVLSGLNEYQALINVNNWSFSVKFNCKPKLSFTCDKDLQKILKQNELTSEEIANGCRNIEEVLEKLNAILTKVLVPLKYYIHPRQSITIIHHLKELGWDNVLEVSKDFNKVQLHATECNRCHKLIITFEKSYPKYDPVIQVQLPIPFKPLLTPNNNKMKNIFTQFKDILPLLQKFWDDMEDLQDNAIIMEPEIPDFSHTKYRISIGKKASVVLTIDPMHLENPPECKFLGPDSLRMQENFILKFDSWNEDLSILQNLRNILMIEIPTKNCSNASEINFNCGICYSFRLENEVPDQYCVNNHCQQIYHHSCLLQWIQSIPGCKQSFNTLFGTCPYCDAKITMSVS